jgi:hypothetical protein
MTQGGHYECTYKTPRGAVKVRPAMPCSGQTRIGPLPSSQPVNLPSSTHHRHHQESRDAHWPMPSLVPQTGEDVAKELFVVTKVRTGPSVIFVLRLRLGD